MRNALWKGLVGDDGLQNDADRDEVAGGGGGGTIFVVINAPLQDRMNLRRGVLMRNGGGGYIHTMAKENRSLRRNSYKHHTIHIMYI